MNNHRGRIKKIEVLELKAIIQHGSIFGDILAIPSKSNLHRQLIYAALADTATHIICADTQAEDITATVDCLTALGAVITKDEDGLCVGASPHFSDTNLVGMPPRSLDSSPRDKKTSSEVRLPCGESGSTLRFMLPIVCAMGLRGAFEMKGRLPNRPLGPLDSQLEKHGIKIWRDTNEVLNVDGQLTAGEFTLPGDVSSQYISGLLMALPLLNKPSTLTITPPFESADYVEMTLDTSKEFNCEIVPKIKGKNIEYAISPTPYKSPLRTQTEGDWSNGAFWLCAGAMNGGNIRLGGLRNDSKQGDRLILDILQKMGADIACNEQIIHVKENKRKCVEVDSRAIPDLIPVLAAVAATCEGTSVFKNASRLRLKESDRLTATAQTLAALGADIDETPDGLIVHGKATLRGGEVDSFGDHRIAMMAAIASAACTEPVIVNGAQAVNKSYPRFWDDLRILGKRVEFC
ncbi:MAG: 3-phosphoshikimate 1-carboxyvinyltransferase [Defluviitaleaceae bacterium]|nr:3-phosphoshikimate 1-carboxyvinyltransferase [Defluviitaleaceae bacterium]